MTPERWPLVHQLFHQALELSVKERSAFLQQTCGGDLELLHYVENLLRADAEPPSLLDASPDHLAMLLPEDEPDHAAASQIGPYRLLQEIGCGGMGAVYLAERADGQFAKQVALKLVKRGMDTDDILRRFRYERQILAALEHPYIARLYDGGLSEDGRPYLVMEYVDGQPLDQYCDEHCLSIDDRLNLFLHVCEAVQYAHRNLVVHRDLKPSNILVTRDGRVKLLDFGIAKLLSEEPEGLSIPMTRTGVRVMTPEYAAPEQVQGGGITTATDVYALGVILYVLMTGRRPHGHFRQEGWKLEQAVLATVPERPSSVVTKAAEPSTWTGKPDEVTPEAVCAARGTSVDRLQRRLRGDLDTIILKALRKVPERRYISVAAFQEDVERYLAGLPVSARPDTLGYRTRTFVRRNKIAVIAGLLVLVALVSGLGTALWQARRAERERDVAQQVSAFLETLFRAPSPALQDTERLDTLQVGAVLRLGAQKVRRELQDQPMLQSQMMHILGNVFNDLALYEEARPLLEDALMLRRRIYGERHPDVANTLEALGLLHQQQGSYATAESLHRQVLSVRTTFTGEDGLATAKSHNNLATALEANSRYDEALQHYQRALHIARLHTTSDPAFHAEVANNLGQWYYTQNNYEAAEPLYRASIQTLRRQPNPRHPKLAMSLNNLASLLHYSGDMVAAEPLYAEALNIFQEVYGDVHPEVSNTLQNLATLHDDLDHHGTADSLYRKALRIDQQLFGNHHPNVGLTVRNLALLHLEIGANTEAERLLREAQTIFEATLPVDHLYRALTEVSLGKVLTRQGRLREAEPLLQHGLDVLLQQLPENHWLIGITQRDLGAYYLARGDLEEAETFLQFGYTVLQPQGGDVLEELLESLIRLYEAWDRPEEATKYREQLNSL